MINMLWGLCVVHGDVMMYVFEIRSMALNFLAKQQPDTLYQTPPLDMYKENLYRTHFDGDCFIFVD